ncbi:unnamed protein product [Paramecium primaurelia]|uniref:Uncharacterized protein n=1 Tax=Paramecium primaurelia TaxID=5886 RepID=A0A8S1NYY8_PARPR|nr:unnamed protein product [Paramecium primaurelia]
MSLIEQCIVKIDRIIRPKIIKNLHACIQNTLDGRGGNKTFLKYYPLIEPYPVLITNPIFYQYGDILITLVPSNSVCSYISFDNSFMAYLGIGTVSPVKVASLTITSPFISRQSQFNCRCSSIKNQSPTTNSLPSIILLSINLTFYLIFANYQSYNLDFLIRKQLIRQAKNENEIKTIENIMKPNINEFNQYPQQSIRVQKNIITYKMDLLILKINKLIMIILEPIIYYFHKYHILIYDLNQCQLAFTIIFIQFLLYYVLENQQVEMSHDSINTLKINLINVINTYRQNKKCCQLQSFYIYFINYLNQQLDNECIIIHQSQQIEQFYRVYCSISLIMQIENK